MSPGPGENWRCPQLAVFADAVCEEKQVPQTFWDHTKICRICLYWASYYCAAMKALATVDRLYHHDCPPKSNFETLLFGAVHVAIEEKLSRPNKNLHSSQIEDAPQLIKVRAHFNRDNEGYCELCFKYYEGLFAAMIENQKRYEAILLAGGEIEKIEDCATHLDCEKIGYDPKKKPN